MKRVQTDPLGWALLAFTVVGGLGGGWRALNRAVGPGPACVWVWDLAAHMDFGLDRNGIVVERRPHTGSPPPRDAPVLPPELDGEVSKGRSQPLAAALDEPGWGRARPGCWVLLGEPSIASPRVPRADAVFLERWVHTGQPQRWQRAFRLRLPWPSRALDSCAEGVWVGAARTCALRFIGHDGNLRAHSEFTDAAGIEALLAVSTAAGGGVWAAAGGALLRLSRDGRRLPGQGGFAHLVTVHAAAPHAPRTNFSRAR